MMKIALILQKSTPVRVQPVLQELLTLLEAQNMRVELFYPEESLLQLDRLQLDRLQLDRLAVQADLYLLKSHTELAMSLGAILHTRGAPMINAYPACMVVRDKVIATQMMRMAGIPAPRSWVTSNLGLIHQLVAAHPVIIKPHQGYSGAGVRLVRNQDELAAIEPTMDPLLVQEYIQGLGHDLKVYVVGDRVFAVRKGFSSTSFTQAGEPSRVSAEVENIARRCGQLFGLELYGLDLIEGGDGPVVMDLNFFPGYKGIPGIAPVLADFIAQRTRTYAVHPVELPYHITNGYRHLAKSINIP